MGRDGSATRVSYISMLSSDAASQYRRNYDDAIRVMQRATAVPKNTKVNYHDHVRSKTVISALLLTCAF